MTSRETAVAADLVEAANALHHLVQQRDELITSVNNKLQSDPNGLYGFQMGASSVRLPINSPECRRVLAEILQCVTTQIAQAAKHVTAVMAMFQEANSDKLELYSARVRGTPPAAAPPAGWSAISREELARFASDPDPDPDESPIQFVSEPL